MLTMLLLMGCPLISDAEIDAKLTPGGGDTAVDDSAGGDSADTSATSDSADSADSGNDTATSVDADADGYDADVDCDDADATIHPDAEETWYDGIDSDCAGNDDDDQDGDGYASVDRGGDDCVDDPLTLFAMPEGFTVLIAADVHPGAAERWYDGIDQDCGGEDDFDQDADGLRAEGHPDAGGYDGVDCDDTDADLSPFAAEIWYDGVDQNCDGANDYDQDGDGYCPVDFAGRPGCSTFNTDCNDNPEFPSPALDGFADLAAVDVHPGATEVWYDGIDGNCDGEDDFDADGDSHRSADFDDGTGVPGDDCDDTERYVSPTAFELWYDGVDDNCDGNDGDQDGDGYCRAGYVDTLGCLVGGGDCQDNPGSLLPALNGFPDLSAAAVHPDASESWYDGVDQDCLGDDDFDEDGDGVATDEYAAAGGAVGTDCDDLDPARSPLVPEIWYDGIDEHCDGGDDYDSDGDGSDAPAGGGTDCDDTSPLVSPAAVETCATTVDDDCDGTNNDVDAMACTRFFFDSDADGFGTTLNQCTCGAEGSYTSTVSTDCLDTSNAVHPGVPEVCNDRIDNNCDGAGCRLSDHMGDFSATSTTTPHYYGGGLSALAGTTVSGVRDWTGDGLNDYVIGAPGAGNGTVYLVEGSTTPASATPPSVRAFTGESAADGVGNAVAGAWDVNGDGDADFLVGAAGQSASGVGAGAAYVVLGSRVASGSLSAATKFTGVSINDHAGDSVAGLGNFDGDAYSDFVVAAPGASGGYGVAYVQRGAATLSSGTLAYAVTYTGTSNYRVSKVGTAGDTNGDGLGDVMIGDSYNARVMIVYGDASPANLTLNNALFTASPATTAVAFTPTTLGGGFGLVIAGAGDVDADGYGDILAGAPGHTSGQGALIVVRGEAAPVSHALDSSFIFATGAGSEYLGASVSPAGDIDDDGRMDVLVGAPGVYPGVNLATASSGTGTTRGKVYLYFGATSGLTTTGMLRWEGLANGNYLGYSVSSLGDVNGDRYRDLLFGEPGNDQTFSLAGAAYLARGYGM